MHGAVAQAMLEVDGDHLDERAALLAHHWQAAGRARDAARWHARAATWAGTRDPAQAAQHWAQVRALCAELPAEPETTGLALTACLWTLQFSWRLGIDDAEVDAVHAEGLRLGRELGDEAVVALIDTTWAQVVGISRDMSIALEPARQAHEVVRSAGRTEIEVPILTFLSYALMISGDLPASERAAARGLELTAADPGLGAGVPVQHPHSWFRMLHAFTRGVQGHLDEGRAGMARAVQLAGAAGDLETLGWAHMNHGVLGWLSGETAGVDEHVMRSVEIADSIGSPFSRIWARYNLGVAHVINDRLDDAVQALREGREMIERHGTGRECEPWTLGMLATALLKLGRSAEALAGAREGLDLAERRGVANVRPWLLSVLARALLAERGAEAAGEARAHLERALPEMQSHRAGGFLPDLYLALAEAHEAAGDAGARAAALRQARDLAARNGATGILRRIDEMRLPSRLA